MKRFILAFLISLGSYPATADLIITAVYDGPLTGGIPKGVELFVTSDIADLSIYGLGGANNGGGTDGEEFTFPAQSATAGSYIYVASEAPGFTEFFTFAPDFVSAAMSINGDDAIELFKNGQVFDLFGDVDVSGSGQAWDYQDGWAYRRSGASASTTFFAADWLFSGANALDGETNNLNAQVPVPISTYTSSGGGSQTTIIINELDADTSGTDVLEFIELFDGGVGNSSLDGLSIVLFNGNGDVSYRAFDLDGMSTNSDGYFVLGNPGVAGVDLSIGTSNIIQNGADAVVLVAGDSSDYPNGTIVSVENLIDALVYDTDDADDSGLLILLNPNQAQINESGGVDSALESNQRCANGSGGLRNTESYIQAAPTPGAINNCPGDAILRFISEIQGTPDTHVSNNFGETDVSPLDGQSVIIEGVVVGDFQDGDADTKRDLRGFFVQEEVSDEDGDIRSSEGVFVFDSNFGVDVKLGDQVRVSGVVGQFFGETQIENVTAVNVLASDQLSLISAANISLLAQSAVSINQDGNYQADLEAFEGMLVTITDRLQIAEQFQLDRFNEVKLVLGERPQQFTQNNLPDPIAYEAFLQALGARQISYDDGLNFQNSSVSNLDGFENYNETTAKRMGDITDNLSGILDYKWAGNSASGATWRVRSHLDGVNQFTSTELGDSPNSRPVAPEIVNGEISENTFKITSFNVLNFFTTIDETGVVTAAGHDPRGADSIEELDRQLIKLVNAIVTLDADIVGLVELENDFDTVNDGSTAIEVLVNAINQRLGATVYNYVYPGQQFVGSDAIAVGFIYKPGVVEIAKGSTVALLDDGVAKTLESFSGRDFSTNPLFNGVATNRVSLAVTFNHLESGTLITAVANHLKSKGASGLTDTASLDFDQLDGAAFWNQRRLDGVKAVSEWLTTNPTGVETDKRALLGDFNAYAMEDPIQYLIGQGFNNVEDSDAYSFVFDGQIGTLDYILLSDSLFSDFVGASIWHINSDEADALDYNLDFGRDPAYFNGNTATRNSDHDPLLVGLEFTNEPLTITELLDTLQSGIAEDNLKGNSEFAIVARVKLILFRSLLVKTDFFLQKNKIPQACHFLDKAIRASEGETSHRSLLAGSGLNEFNALIQTTFVDVGCIE